MRPVTSPASARPRQESSPNGRQLSSLISGERPNGQFDEPSDLLRADKADFGSSRIRRWFGRDWTSY
jgi:hypothetical protein